MKDNNLLYVSALSFVFIATLCLSNTSVVRLSAQAKPATVEKVFTPLPVLVGDSSYPIISAQAALVIDMPSGVSLYEKSPDTPFLPASTTKIVTALVAMDNYSLDDVVSVVDPSVEGQKMKLVAGEKITIESLLKGLLIESANDAAVVLADNFPGGRERFVDAMNQKAVELKLTNSYFENPAGLDGNDQKTTARDLVRVASVAMRNLFFAQLVATRKDEVASVDGNIKHYLVSTNKLLGNVDGVLGVKTGWTENARENLVTYLERGERRIMISVMGSQDRFGETKELIDWAWANYEWKEVKYTSE